MNPLSEETISLLSDVEQALDDWVVTYAEDHCSKEKVKAAWTRISENGGTLAYVTDLRERVTTLLEKNELHPTI